MKTVIITGATSGIGSAATRAFAADGARVFLIGRSAARLAALARRVPPRRLAGTALADLSALADLKRLLADIRARVRRADVLLHCAGEHDWTQAGRAEAARFDLLFAVNVRAPYLLTQGLLPPLQRARGQVIFINSSVVRTAGAGVAAYKATRHALQGLTDSLRQDLNRRGLRVTSVYPGRTATARMRRIYAHEKKRYHAGDLMSARDLAQVLLALTRAPARIEITDLHLRAPRPY
jgi:NADP-dependent 3-hydroxy acid dehydrogenase YdfG